MSTKIAIAHADQAGGAMNILDSWAVELKEYAESLSYNVIDISGPDMTYDRMPAILEETKPALLINFSFGGKTRLWGNPVDGMTKPTLTQGNGMPGNLDVLKEIAVISYSSYTAGELGTNMIKAGCQSLAGFTETFIIIADKEKTENIFKESELPLAKRVLDGHTMRYAVESTCNNLIETARKYKTRQILTMPLRFNGRYLTLLGDPNWKLKSGGN